MAVHNGRRHLAEQIVSILAQLGEEDELVIVDDSSDDDSLEIVERFGDARIQIIRNETNVGIVRSFERAITASNGDTVFLADQDDIWLPGRLQRVLDTMASTACTAVVTDAFVIDQDGKVVHPSYFRLRRSGPGYIRNLWRNSYLGCTMAFDARAKAWVLPFPKTVNMHDEWIGLMCDLLGTVEFLDERLHAYRRHEDNATAMTPSSVPSMARKRLVHLAATLARAVSLRLTS